MNRLPFDAKTVEQWTEDYKTPFYVYDEEGIKNCVRRLYNAFSWNKGFREYFAVKATPTPAILRLLESLGCGADCASLTEIMLATRCDITGKKIMFSSNETRPEEYRAAVSAGAIINLDDISQIEILEKSAGIPDTVCCRYNPGSFKITNSIIGHLHDTKFGMTPEQLFAAFSVLKEKGVKHFGIHAMLSSCSLEQIYYGSLSHELFTLAVKIKNELGICVEFIDLSGGIGIPYRPGEKAVDIAAIGNSVREEYEKVLTPEGLAPSIYTELGRYITAPYGYLVTRVIGKKDIYKKYVGVDATACDLMRPAMYGAYHEIVVAGKEDVEKTETVDVVGSLCENNDKFAVDRPMPPTELGDLLVICDCGAHGRSMGYNYNGKLRCGELMMHSDKSVTMIRRAETPEDYFATFDIDSDFSKRL